jgi:hypothetical protein
MVKELADRLRTRPLNAADSQELEQLFVVGINVLLITRLVTLRA